MLKRWECSCINPFSENKGHTLLGFIEDGKIVRIKNKDLYVEIEGGKVTVNCRYCGKRHTLTDSNFKQEVPEAQEKEIRT